MEIALSIAGSDSGGGAGIQADLKTFHQFGVFGTSVITAITAQNTVGVSDWTAVEVSLVRAQLRAVISDLRPAALKSGMLPNSGIIREVAKTIEENGLSNYVLDPVMVATSGDVLFDKNAVAAIKSQLMPLATLATPNLYETHVLLGKPIESVAAMRSAAERISRDFGARAVLVKGGHLPGSGDIVDILYDGALTEFRHPRIETSSTHGTGCTLAAAIAAQLALGVPLRKAVETAVDYVRRAITEAPKFGSGHGPLNHFVSPAT